MLTFCQAYLGGGNMAVLFDDGNVQVRKLVLGPYGNNAYVLVCPHTKECAIFDTPAEPEKLLAEIAGLQVTAILFTHTHFDHLMGFETIVGSTGAPVGIHPAGQEKLPSPPALLIQDGTELKIGRLTLKAIHTPGHTPDSVCYLVGRHLFSGDTLFPGGPGRTSSPDDLQQVIRSITQRLHLLPRTTAVYPGHGDETTIAKSKEEYKVFASRPHKPDLCGDVLWLES